MISHECTCVGALLREGHDDFLALLCSLAASRCSQMVCSLHLGRACRSHFRHEVQRASSLLFNAACVSSAMLG